MLVQQTRISSSTFLFGSGFVRVREGQKKSDRSIVPPDPTILLEGEYGPATLTQNFYVSKTYEL
jgi:hypothetical protein